MSTTNLLVLVLLASTHHPVLGMDDPNNNTAKASRPEHSVVARVSHHFHDRLMIESARKLLEENPLALLEACTRGSIEEVKALIACGAPLDTQDKAGATALHRACARLAYQNYHAALIPVLLAAGACLRARDHHGLTPFHYALNALPVSFVTTENDIARTKNIIQSLIRAGASVHDRIPISLRTPLHLAAEKGTIGAVKALIEAGAPLDAQDASGATPLHRACARWHWWKSQAILIQMFIDAGASVYAQDYSGLVPLHYALNALPATDHDNDEMCVKDTIKRLVKAGASINAQIPGSLQSPLHIAVEKCFIKFVKFLLNHGADVNSQNAQKETPLHIAVTRTRNSRDLIITLLDHGASLALQDIFGNTPLHMGVNKKRSDISSFIIKDFFMLGKFHLKSFYSPTTVYQPLKLKQICLLFLLKRWQMYLSQKNFDGYVPELKKLIKESNLFNAIAELPLCEQHHILRQQGNDAQFRRALIVAHGEHHLKGVQATLAIKNNEGKTVQDLLAEKHQSKLLETFNELTRAQRLSDIHVNIQQIIEQHITAALETPP